MTRTESGLKSQSKRTVPLIAILAGAVLGFVGGPVQILLIWGLVAIMLGYFSSTLRLTIASGIIFGFIVSFMFMITGYTGDAPVYTHLLPFAALGVFGGICGLFLSITGYYLHALISKQSVSKTARR